MNNLNLKNIAEALINTFFEAGKIAKQISQRGVKITIKADKSPVTPDIPIISEETVDLNIENENKTFWLIDPIDGTREYISKKDEYTLNAALIIDLKPAIGVFMLLKKIDCFTLMVKIMLLKSITERL